MRLPFLRRGGDQHRISYQVVEVIGASAKGLDDAVERAAEHIAERQRTGRTLPRVNLVGLALFGAAAGGAYAAARALLERSTTALPLPEPLDAVAADASDGLRHAREAVKAGIVEARRATRDAERELREDYLSRTGRGEPAAGEPDAS